MPKMVVTVPRDLYDAVEAATYEAFADSYLSGAVAQDGRLVPRTQVAWSRIRDSHSAMRALKFAGYTLIKPNPYRD